MRKFLVVLLICAGCGGKLTDEQRQKLHEGMATQDIKRVTEADLQEAALAYGKSVMQSIENTDTSLGEKLRIDSLENHFHVKIYALTPAGKALREIEKQLVDAYVTGGGESTVSDNLQKVGTDSLLYTRPVFKSGPDGTLQFSHAIGILMSKKTVVLSMPQP